MATSNALTPRATPAGARHVPKRASSWVRSWASGRSLTTKIVALSGRIQVWWKRTSSSRVSERTTAMSPEPVNGFP